VAVDLTAKETLTNIYSPTHSVGVTRKDDHHAVIGFEQDRALLDRDFLLYYAVSAKDLGLNLITYRPDPQKPGYFMMLISPREEMSEEKVLPRDMTFVFDTSGSMQGEKIQQARAALRYCVQGLKPQDRFNIVAFSTTTDPFQAGLVEASGENIKAALAYIDKLEARGGTDINSALTQALSAKGSAAKGAEERPATILFMTDGRPTVGVTEPEEILKNVRQANKAETRIFVFGVGDDVNTHLLDKVSGENKGLSDYVRPNEDIEVKVSSLFNKIRKPVLADVTLAVDKVTIRDCYPTELGDLFAGTELTLLGRYDKPGDALIRLTGTARAEKKSFDYEGTFAEKDVEHQFVAHLWATRKIGYLLDQVRLHGESKELRDEVVALSTEFGIPTPYTSYLALPDAERGRYLGDRGVGPTFSIGTTRNAFRTSPEAPAAAAAPSSSFNEARRQREAAPMAAPSGGGRPGAAGGAGGGGGGDLRMYSYMRPETGAEAVEAAKSIADLKRAERPTGLAIKKVGERTFEYWSGFWVDRQYKTEMPTVEVKYLSDAYFKILAAAPELKDVFALGDRVVVVLKGKALVIQAEGKEDMSDKDVADLLGR
jgi:Ca-activated chloride channel family protein